jgi:predicted Zn-dependent protease
MCTRLTPLSSKFSPFRFPASVALSLVLSFSVSWAQAQVTGALTAGTSTHLPSLGDNSELASAAERRIGDRIAASIYRDPDYIDDPVLWDYVQSIWQPLMAAARARGELHAELQERFAWEFFLIRDRTVNAFALPGGYFGIHLGLIGIVSNRDELAAVLGHEMSHVTQRHISRLLTQQSRQAPWLIGAMILGALAASRNPQAASAAIVGGQAVAAQSQLDFSRDMEREADRVGFGVMTDAGFESRGVASMFEKLQQAARLNDNGSFPYLRSHPLSSQRIAEAQARYQLSPKTAAPGAADAAEPAKARFLHAMMAARARVLVEPGVDLLRTTVAEAQRATGPATASALPVPAYSRDDRGAGVLYAGAFAAAKLRDFAQAQALATRLISLSNGNAGAHQAANLLALEIDLLAGKIPAQTPAIKLSQASTRADVLMGGRALLSADRAPEVSERLQTWVSANPRDATAWQLLSLAYGKQGQNVRAVRAEAEARFAQLDYAGALDRFRAAQEMIRSNPASADFMEGSIIDARTRQVDSLVKEQALQDKLDR